MFCCTASTGACLQPLWITPWTCLLGSLGWPCMFGNCLSDLSGQVVACMEAASFRGPLVLAYVSIASHLPPDARSGDQRRGRPDNNDSILLWLCHATIISAASGL